MPAFADDRFAVYLAIFLETEGGFFGSKAGIDTCDRNQGNIGAIFENENGISPGRSS
jgi:hypothetical protein